MQSQLPSVSHMGWW